MTRRANPQAFGVAWPSLLTLKPRNSSNGKHHNDINSSALLDSWLPAKVRHLPQAQFPLYLGAVSPPTTSVANRAYRLSSTVERCLPYETNRTVGSIRRLDKSWLRN